MLQVFSCSFLIVIYWFIKLQESFKGIVVRIWRTAYGIISYFFILCLSIEIILISLKFKIKMELYEFFLKKQMLLVS